VFNAMLKLAWKWIPKLRQRNMLKETTMMPKLKSFEDLLSGGLKMVSRLFILLMISAVALAADPSPPTINVVAGRTVTISWAAVTTDIDGNKLTTVVSYKVFNVTNGVIGFIGYAHELKMVYTAKNSTCFYVTAVIWGPYRESKPSSQACVTVT
jgi:hypothetical protein